MFARRLTFALAALAFAAALEAVVAIWALNLANEHVLRGRVASDIQLSFHQLNVTKLRLRDWFTRMQIEPHARNDLWRRYITDMHSVLAQIDALAQRAIALDRNGTGSSEHQLRHDALAVLNESVLALEAAALKFEKAPRPPKAPQSGQAVDDLFDHANGHDMRKLLADSVQRELAAVQRERAAADQALRWMRDLLLGAAVTIALGALLFAARLSRALRRPLNELHAGAQALQQGQLTHRIPVTGQDEFSAVARSMNTMAVELSEHRAGEAQARHQLEELVQARTMELQNALEALQQVDARRRRLFADISHELRTPTTAILGEAAITLRGKPKSTADYRAAMECIAASARQLGAVIEDLLTIARSDIDALSLNRQSVDLGPAVREVVEQAAALAHDRHISVQAQGLPEGPLAVWGDPQRLRQLLMLLLDNAVRYSHAHSAVTITLHCPTEPYAPDAAQAPQMPTHCELHIRDQGIGIAPEDLPHVFDRHFRSARARQHRADGSGLGLSMARTLARAHQGELHLNSQLGQGTTVVLKLPLLRP